VKAVVDVSMKIGAGEFFGVIGESGSGKTTLLRMLACQLKPDAGNILVAGERVPDPASGAGARFRSRHIGYVFQEFGLIEEDSAVANVALPLRYSGATRRRAVAMARDVLEELGLADETDAVVRDLSAGQRQRVALARATVNDPMIIIADEPTSNLDHRNRDLVLASLKAIAARGKTVIMATHAEAAWQACDRTISLARGRLVSGTNP